MPHTMFDSMDSQDKYPAAYDSNGDEIWHDDHTVIYEGKEVVWETFMDKIISLIKPVGIPNKLGVLTLARAMELDIKEYE